MSEEARLPWFKFDPQVWLSDRDVLRLTQAQRGCYIDLLSHDWISRGIPSNPTEACLLLTGGAKVADVSAVLALFKVDVGGGLVTHQRSERQRIAFESKSGAAKASAKARWRDANGMRTHEFRTCESDANASVPHSEKPESAVRSDAPPRARIRAKESDKEEEIREDNTPLTKSISLPKGAKEIDSRGGVPLSLSRPATEAEALKLCRGQMVDAPAEFVARCFHGLASVGWVNGTGTAEITNFPSYVRKAWINEKDDRARKASTRAQKPGHGEASGLPEGIAEKVVGLWNAKATKSGLPALEAITPERIAGVARLWERIGVGESEQERLDGIGYWCRLVGENKGLADRHRRNIPAGFDWLTTTDTRIIQVAEGGI